MGVFLFLLTMYGKFANFGSNERNILFNLYQSVELKAKFYKNQFNLREKLNFHPTITKNIRWLKIRVRSQKLYWIFYVFYIKFMDFWSLLNLKVFLNKPKFKLNLALK